MVDDVRAHLGQTMHIGLAGTEVTTLDGVVKESINAVAVILIILGGVDATLRGDRVRAARAVLIAEAFHIVALLGERRGG